MILITRPQPQAAALERRLQDMGIACLCQPLLDIRFLAGPASDAPLISPPPQAILATSANGVRALARYKGYPRNAAPLLAIGAATAREAHEAGFAPVWSGTGHAESLLALAEWHCRRSDGELLHVCGRDVSVDIAALLRARGFSARRVVLYEAITASCLDDAVANALRRGEIDGILLYSRRTAQVWERLLRAAGLQEQCRTMTAYCLAKSAVEVAAMLPFRDIVTAERPDEESLLCLLPGAAQRYSIGEMPQRGKKNMLAQNAGEE